MLIKSVGVHDCCDIMNLLCGIPPHDDGDLDMERSEENNRQLCVQRLAYSLDELAEATGLSKRMLWELTNRNEIPHRRVGRRILYPVKLIESWLEEKSTRQRKCS